jgi:hypothetical protein
MSLHLAWKRNHVGILDFDRDFHLCFPSNLLGNQDHNQSCHSNQAKEGTNTTAD